MRRLLLIVSVLASSACGGEDASKIADYGPPQLQDCRSDVDCPAGLSCVDLRCVDDQGLPPEPEVPRTFLRPALVAGRLIALSPEADAAALIDPVNLSIAPVHLPDDPRVLAAVPGSDAALILSPRGRALSWLEPATGALQVQSLPRAYDALTISEDGAFALLWTQDALLDGAEGLFALVELAALRAGTPTPPIERALGRRHVAAAFRHVDGAALDVVILGKESAVIVPLDSGEPELLPLPEAFAEIATREALATADGDFWILRSMGADGLLRLDVETRSLEEIPLPGPATDLSLAEDGSVAAAMIRSTSQLAILAPATAATVSLHEVTLPSRGCETPPCTAAPGRVALSPDGAFATLWTSVEPSDAFLRFDVGTSDILLVDTLQKRVGEVLLAPEGDAAVVVHLAETDSSVADPYERAVDVSEGYSLVDLDSGRAQLTLTADIVPSEVAFASDGRHAALELRDPDDRDHRIDALDLGELITHVLPLPSAPEFLGPMPEGDGIWITQEHPAGRISFLDVASLRLRTVTGFELNGEIE